MRSGSRVSAARFAVVSYYMVCTHCVQKMVYNTVRCNTYKKIDNKYKCVRENMYDKRSTTIFIIIIVVPNIMTHPCIKWKIICFCRRGCIIFTAILLYTYRRVLTMHPSPTLVNIKYVYTYLYA